MAHQFEQGLREAFSYRDAQLDPGAVARIRAVDYRPRRRRLGGPRALGALSATGLAATAGVIVALGSGAAPAFAGWQATPTTPATGQLAQAMQNCGQGLGGAVLSDSRGPYTAAIYSSSDSSDVCLTGNGASMSSEFSSPAAATPAAGQIQFAGGGERDAAGDALTLADGRVGTGVTAVSLELSDGTSVEATVDGGWYLAWWPGNVSAKQVQITTASGISTVAYPATPALACPSGGHCSVGYGFSGDGSLASQSHVYQDVTRGGSSN